MSVPINLSIYLSMYFSISHAPSATPSGSRLWPEECCGSETDQLPEDNATPTTNTSTIAAAAAAAAATLHSPQQQHHQYLSDHPHSLYRGRPQSLQGEPRPSQLLEDDLKEVLTRGSKVSWDDVFFLLLSVYACVVSCL